MNDITIPEALPTKAASSIQPPRLTPIPVLIPTSFDQLVKFAELAARTDMVPRDYRDKPGNVMLAVQMGSELGLSPMQALNSIAVINGRPGVWGDGLIAVCRRSPLCEDIAERFEGEGDDRVAICVAKRRGASPIEGRFSVRDAKRAGLWQTEEKVRRKGRDGSWYDATNDSPWFRYPDRMLRNRARGFALRDAFPDLLRGLRTAEELWDTPPEQDDFRGPTVDAEPVQHEPSSKAAPTPPPQLPSQNGTRDHERAGGTQPRMTIAQFLDGLNRELAMVPDVDAAEALLRSERVKRAQASLTGDAAKRLDAWIGRVQQKIDDLAIAAEAARESEPPAGPGEKPAENITETITQAAAPPPLPDAGAISGPLPESIDEWPIAGEEMMRG